MSSMYALTAFVTSRYEYDGKKEWEHNSLVDINLDIYLFI